MIFACLAASITLGTTTFLDPITPPEIEAALALLPSYNETSAPITIERRFDGWISLEIEEDLSEPSHLQFKLRDGKVVTRFSRIRASSAKRSKALTAMLEDSFSRAYKSGYRSHGFAMWNRLVNYRVGGHFRFVVWDKMPFRFHDEMSVEYSEDMKFETISRGRG